MSRISESETKGIVRDASFFSGATYFSQIMCYLRGFLNARFLNPVGYGLWSALGVLISYGDYSHLGVLQGMNREIASVFKRDKNAVEKIRGAAFAITLVNSFIFAFLMVSFFLILRRPLKNEEIVGILTVGALVIMNNLILFYDMNNAAIQNFILISKVNFSGAFISLTLTLPIVFYLRVYGVFLVALLTALYFIFFYIRMSGFSFRFDFNRNEAFKLIKIGFPLIVLGLLGCIKVSINTLMILGFIGKAGLGLYAVAYLLSQFLGYLPSAVGAVIIPRLYQRYGETKDIQELKKYLIVPTEVLSYLLPILAGLFYFLFSFLIRLMLPAYVESTGPLFWLLFAFVIMSIPTTATGFATALDRQHMLVLFNILAIFVNLFFNYLFLVVLGLGITGVALTVFITYVFYTTCILSYNLRYYFKGLAEYIKYFVRIYLPAVYVIFFTFGIKVFFKSIPNSFILLTGRLGMQILIYSIFSLPIFILLNQKTRFFRWIQETNWFGRLKIYAT